MPPFCHWFWSCSPPHTIPTPTATYFRLRATLTAPSGLSVPSDSGSTRYYGYALSWLIFASWAEGLKPVLYPWVIPLRRLAFKSASQTHYAARAVQRGQDPAHYSQTYPAVVCCSWIIGPPQITDPFLMMIFCNTIHRYQSLLFYPFSSAKCLDVDMQTYIAAFCILTDMICQPRMV